MNGNASEIVMCGIVIQLGDEMEVEYTHGEGLKGGRIKGKVVELWDMRNGRFKQARLSCGWCFHNDDKIIKHVRCDDNAISQ